MIVFFFTVNFHRIKFLAIAVGHAIEVYAWAPKPYHKFMAFKVSSSFKVHKIPDLISLHSLFQLWKGEIKTVWISYVNFISIIIKGNVFLLSVLTDKRQLYFTSIFFYLTVVQKSNAETIDGEHGHTNWQQ